MKIQSEPIKHIAAKNEVNLKTQRYSVEFFHIYIDETISDRHQAGIEYLREIQKAWSLNYDLIVLIDDYNPKKQVTSVSKILDYLNTQNVLPKYWATEAGLIPNAQVFLESITSPKLKKNYQDYINRHNKYPCSLLTASWYLTRLGKLEAEGTIHSTAKKNETYLPAQYLLNLLPQDYKDIESRAQKLVQHSQFAKDIENIQNLYYPTDSGRVLDLF